MRSVRRARCWRFLLAAVLAACGGDASPLSPDSIVDAKYVAGEALAALQRNGEIRLPDLHATDGSEVSEVRAFDLARAFMHDYGDLALEQYEVDRGASIDLAALRTCPRAFYVTGSYDVNAGEVSDIGRRYIGAHWLVSFCNHDGAPIISISLSARAVDVTIQHPPNELPAPGSNFFSAGIPIAVTAVPPSPESVIKAVAVLTGKRVTKIPQLIPAHIPFSAQVAKWRITIEDSVNIRGLTSGTRERTAELYYGFGDDWKSVGLQRGIPAIDPTEIFYDFVNGSIVPITIHRKADIPVGFEPAVIENP